MRVRSRRAIRALIALSCCAVAVVGSAAGASAQGAGPASGLASMVSGSHLLLLSAQVPRPVVTKLSTSSAKPAVRLIITGRGFGARRGKGLVLFGRYKATSYAQWDAKRIVCKVPVIPAGKLQLEVRTAGGTSKGHSFTVRALPIVVPKTTEVLDTATVAGASTADGASYSFTDTSQTGDLAPGDVIVGRPSASLPDGVLGKVTAVSDDGASVTTAPVTLDQLFTSAQFSASHPLTQSDFTGSPRLAPGVRLLRSVVVRPGTRLLSLQLRDVGITEQEGLDTDFGPVKVSGTITLSITVHVAGAIGWGGVKSFETSETTTVGSDLDASVTDELGFANEKTLASWGAGQIAGFDVQVGPVPLYFQPQLSIFVGADGEFQAGVESGVHYTASGTFGLTYQAPNFRPLSSFVTSPDSTSYTQLGVSAGGAVKVYAGAQLELALYDLAGPFIRLDGYSKLAADTTKTPWWTLKAGLEGSVGAQIGANLGFIDWDADWKSGDLTLKEWTLAHASTPAPTPSPTPTPTPTNGLVGHWKFDDSADLGRDSSGMGNDGTAAAGYVTYSPDGKVGGAADFTAGSDAGITVPDAPSLDFTGGITVAAWVKIDLDDSGDATILSKSDQSSDEPYVFWASFWKTNDDMAAFFDGASADDSGASVTQGSWQHVAMTYDGLPGGIVSFYLDGVQVASEISNADGLDTNTSSLALGASPCPDAEDFSGLLDEVRLYDRALSSTEIATLYGENR